jgi:hypothetical protein
MKDCLKLGMHVKYPRKERRSSEIGNNNFFAAILKYLSIVKLSAFDYVVPAQIHSIRKQTETQ